MDGVVSRYIGESGFSPNTQAGLHQTGLKAGDPWSALWEHAACLHGAQEGEGKDAVEMFSMKVTRNYSSRSRRLIAEAVLIDQELQLKRNKDITEDRRTRVVMNSKAHWFQPAVVKVLASSEFKY